MRINKFLLVTLVVGFGLIQVPAQVRSGGGAAVNGSVRGTTPNNSNPSAGAQNTSGSENPGDTTGNANIDSSTANNGLDGGVPGQPFGRINNNLQGNQNPGQNPQNPGLNPDGTAIAGQDQRFNFRNTNRFGMNTNRLNAFNTNRFGFGTNEFGVITNRFGAVTNQMGRFGFGGTNRTMTPTSNRGTNRFYGTNTIPGNQTSGLRDRAVSPTDQILLTHIQQTLDPKLGITSVDNSPVHFLVQQNNVTLMGFATSPEQKALIVSIVKGVPGVVSVQDNLVVGAALANPGFQNNPSGTIGVSARSVDGVPAQISLNPSGIDSNSPLERRLSIGTNGVTGGAPIGEPPVAPVPPAPNAVPQQ